MIRRGPSHPVLRWHPSANRSLGAQKPQSLQRESKEGCGLMWKTREELERATTS